MTTRDSDAIVEQAPLAPAALPVVNPATVADTPAVMTLLARAVAHMRSLGIEQWDEVYPDRARIDADIAAGQLYLAHRGETALGMVVLNEQQSPEYASVPWQYDAARILVVHRLCVDPAAERRGVARGLMAFSEQHARDEDYGAIRLDAFALNPRAVRLYEQLGYAKAGQVQFRKGAFYCYEKRVNTGSQRGGAGRS